MDSGKAGWGGSRNGAGRKPKPTLAAHLAIPREVWAAIQVRAAIHGTTPEQEAVRILTENVEPVLSK